MTCSLDNMTKSEFCFWFEWEITIQWFDKTGVHAMHSPHSRMLARIELHASYESNRYDSFRITIINAREGKVDEKIFLFSDYLDASPEGRQDDRVTGKWSWPGDDQKAYYSANADGKKMSWYIAVPKRTKELCEAIESYIEMFDSP